MELNRLIEDEHEKHYFGYSSTEIYHNLESTVKKSIIYFMDEFREVLLEKKFEEALVEEEVKKLEAVYMKETKMVLEQFKSKIRGIFHIPPNANIYGSSEDTMTINDEEILTLRKELSDLEKKYFIEKQQYDSLLLEKELIKKVKDLEQQYQLNFEEESDGRLEILLTKHAKHANITSNQVDAFI